MSGLLQSNAEGANELASTVQSSLGGYLGFTLSAISLSAPVTGSADHDGLSSGISKALCTWSDLIVSDAKALTSAATELEDIDSTIAGRLMGVGS